MKENSAPTFTIERVGLKRSIFGDLYHYLLLTPWSRFFGLMALVYGVANAIFAAAYLAVPGSLEGGRAESFADAFFFSVQTMATIGYGKILPVTFYANVLVTIESLLGIFGVALVTGLTFAKFARPTARVLFSNVAVVAKRDGARSLMVRLANQRDSQIVDVNIFMVLALNDTTSEGETIRRFHTLELSRPRAATFALTFTVVHVLDDKSALAGFEHAELLARKAEIIVIVTGIDETFAQTVHARMNYGAEALRFGARFVDVVTRVDDARRRVDYRRFHDTQPAE